MELRRDIEKSVGDTNVARSASDPRKSASLITWMTNVSKPSDMGHGTGDGTDTCDLTGTNRALTLAQIESANQEAWEDGGNPQILVCSATNKANISDLSAVRPLRMRHVLVAGLTCVGARSCIYARAGP